MLRSGTKFDTEIVNVLIKDQGLGDMICNIPSLQFAIQNYPHTKFLIWVPDFIVDLYKNLLPGQTIRGYSEAPGKYKENLTAIGTGLWTGSHNSMRTHPVDYAYFSLLNRQPLNNEERNYPKLNTDSINISKFNLPEKYVAISVGATVPVKEMPGSIINEISKYCLKKGYTPVFLGNTKQQIGVENAVLKVLLNDEVDYSLGIDLVNKTSLLETGKIIAESKCLVGMEGGLTHLAGCTNTNIIASYTFADPQTLMPYRNGEKGFKLQAIELPMSLECRYCMTNSNFIFDKEYAQCYYGDYECIKSFHPLQFIQALEKVL